MCRKFTELRGSLRTAAREVEVDRPECLKRLREGRIGEAQAGEFGVGCGIRTGHNDFAAQLVGTSAWPGSESSPCWASRLDASVVRENAPRARDHLRDTFIVLGLVGPQRIRRVSVLDHEENRKLASTKMPRRQAPRFGMLTVLEGEHRYPLVTIRIRGLVRPDRMARVIDQPDPVPSTRAGIRW